jgi:hypothetical protein
MNIRKAAREAAHMSRNMYENSGHRINVYPDGTCTESIGYEAISSNYDGRVEALTFFTHRVSAVIAERQIRKAIPDLCETCRLLVGDMPGDFCYDCEQEQQWADAE